MRLIVFLFIFVSSISYSTANAAGYSWDASGRIRLPNEEPMTFDSFASTIKSQDFSNIAESLQYLKHNNPEAMKFYTMAYDSFSLQESTPQEPRILVFRPDAGFIFSFNGNAKKRGGNSFETMEFDEASKTFLFREIAFKTEVADFKTDLEQNEIAFENDKILISTANPQKCLQCHNNAGPNWGTYDLWPGFYGSDDDKLTRTGGKYSYDATKSPYRDGYYPKHGDREVSEYLKFLRSKLTHPRYKFLPDRVADLPARRFLNTHKRSERETEAIFTAERKRLNIDIDQFPYSIDNYWPDRPNLFLLDHLNDLNKKRIIEALKKVNLAPLQGIDLYGLEWRGNNPPIEYFKSQIPSAFWNDMENKLGPFSSYLDHFMRDEFYMTREKYDRLDRFYGGILAVQGMYPKCNWCKSETLQGQPLSNLAYYQQILNKKIEGPLDTLAMSDPLSGIEWPEDAMIFYILKSQGFDLQSYALDQRRVEFNTGLGDEFGFIFDFFKKENQ